VFVPASGYVSEREKATGQLFCSLAKTIQTGSERGYSNLDGRRILRGEIRIDASGDAALSCLKFHEKRINGNGSLGQGLIW
jgi:hypothetical protein